MDKDKGETLASTVSGRADVQPVAHGAIIRTGKLAGRNPESQLLFALPLPVNSGKLFVPSSSQQND
jgi:hypothetical protein